MLSLSLVWTLIFNHTSKQATTKTKRSSGFCFHAFCCNQDFGLEHSDFNTLLCSFRKYEILHTHTHTQNFIRKNLYSLSFVCVNFLGFLGYLEFVSRGKQSQELEVEVFLAYVNLNTCRFVSNIWNGFFFTDSCIFDMKRMLHHNITHPFSTRYLWTKHLS